MSALVRSIPVRCTCKTPAMAVTIRGSWSTCVRQVNMTEGTCAYCGEPATRKYCDQKCYGLACRRSERVAVTCPCGTVFETSANKIAAGRGKFCSKPCMYRYKTSYERKPQPGFISPTSFRPGSVPWNKGVEGWIVPWNKGLKGTHFSPSTEFKPGQNAGEENFNWAGGDVGYAGLHFRVRKKLGAAADHSCAFADETCKGPMNWANISGQYLDEDDFMALCQSHHARYDGVRVRK